MLNVVVFIVIIMIDSCFFSKRIVEMHTVKDAYGNSDSRSHKLMNGLKGI